MTEHAGRAHRIDERPVAAPVPRQHGAPPFVVVHGQGCRLGHGAHGTRAGGEIYPKLVLELVEGGGVGLGVGAVAGVDSHTQTPEHTLRRRVPGNAWLATRRYLVQAGASTGETGGED